MGGRDDAFRAIVPMRYEWFQKRYAFNYIAYYLQRGQYLPKSRRTNYFDRPCMSQKVTYRYRYGRVELSSSLFLFIVYGNSDGETLIKA
jgi:hypothetical protein